MAFLGTERTLGRRDGETPGDTEKKQEVQDERQVTPCDRMEININGLI